jgi:hypothetical protein
LSLSSLQPIKSRLLAIQSESKWGFIVVFLVIIIV